MKRILLFAWFLLSFTLSLCAAQALMPQQAYEQVRLRAADQHEVVILLIKKGQFGQVLAETRKLLAIKVPSQFEAKLVDSAAVIADALHHKGQLDLAQQVLDEAANTVTLGKSKAECYRRKAFFFKKQGKEDLAIRFYKMAMDADKP